jgi:hypothetical protein
MKVPWRQSPVTLVRFGGWPNATALAATNGCESDQGHATTLVKHMLRPSRRWSSNVACLMRFPLQSLLDRRGILQQRKAQRAYRISITLISMLGCLLCVAPAAQAVGPPPPIKVQVVNDSNQTLLLAAFGKTAVDPEGGLANWVLQPNGGTLTLNIPNEWFNTLAQGSKGPRIWARTGCRYNVSTGRAQCETGNCGDKFDCGTAGPGGIPLAGVAPVSIAEFCFNCPPADNPSIYLNDWDVSAVDGVNLSMNIEPTGTFSPTHPPGIGDPFWCQLAPSNSVPSVNSYSANAISGEDLRAPASCPNNFQLKSSDLGMYIEGGGGPDNVVACFSNCGAYEYGIAPASNCQDTDPNDKSTYDVRCGAWREYCCQTNDYGKNDCDPAKGTNQPDGCLYGNHECTPGIGNPTEGTCPVHTCTQDSDCNPSDTCWNYNSGPGICACRGFVVNPTNPPYNCSSDTCTNDELAAAEPYFGTCSQTTDTNGLASNLCIGDDTVHTVFPRAYTWPNDPQTYDCDNRAFRVTISPGGVPSDAPITPAGPIPLCGSLPEQYYGTSQAYLPPAAGDKDGTGYCSIPVDRDHAVFAGAVQLTNKVNNHWACDLGKDGTVPEGGVLCSWNALPAP